MTISFLQIVELFKASLGGIVVAVLICPLAIGIAKRIGFLDIPGSAQHKQHAKPTPLAGGIVLILSLIVLMTVFKLWYRPYSTLFIAAAIVFIFGLLDDYRSLTVFQKLIGQILASILLIASDVSIKFLDNFTLSFLSATLVTFLNWILTFIWLVGISNSVNLIDSMDGLATGITGIAFAFFMGMALVSKQDTLALFSAILLGVCIGLYGFNVTPARLFLGDSGAQTIGFILAAVAMIYSPDNLPQGSSWFVPILVLGMPIFDTTLVVISRIRQHKSVFRADRTHTYHRLVALGLSPNRAVLSIHITTLVLNFLAFIALSLPPLRANLVFFSAVAIGVVFLILLMRKTPQID